MWFHWDCVLVVAVPAVERIALLQVVFMLTVSIHALESQLVS